MNERVNTHLRTAYAPSFALLIASLDGVSVVELFWATSITKTFKKDGTYNQPLIDSAVVATDHKSPHSKSFKFFEVDWDRGPDGRVCAKRFWSAQYHEF